MIPNKKKDRRGAKRKTPDTAIMKLIYDYGLSSYYFQKENIMSAGRLINASKENIDRLSLKFFMQLAGALNLKVTTVIVKLLKLQKIYPPKVEKRKSK